MNHIDSHQSMQRRQFIRGASTLLSSAAIIAASQSLSPSASAATSTSKFKKQKSGIHPNDVILFQGDSITDAGWNREKGATPNLQAGLGSGYAWLAAASLLADRPTDGLKIYNRGISGNKVYQLAERWDKDCLELKPDVLSILIGVNDIWHTLGGNYKGTIEIYERDYRALLERTRKTLPKTRLVVCEPFVLRCGAVNEKWFPEFDGYRAAAKRVADFANALFVPFQTMFDHAIQFAPPDHWAKDGVHPSSAGAALMAHTWLRVVNSGKS